jgi:hypothetical protein
MHWYPASNENTGSVEIRTNTYKKFGGEFVVRPVNYYENNIDVWKIL